MDRAVFSVFVKAKGTTYRTFVADKTWEAFKAEIVAYSKSDSEIEFFFNEVLLVVDGAFPLRELYDYVCRITKDEDERSLIVRAECGAEFAERGRLIRVFAGPQKGVLYDLLHGERRLTKYTAKLGGRASFASTMGTVGIVEILSNLDVAPFKCRSLVISDQVGTQGSHCTLKKEGSAPIVLRCWGEVAFAELRDAIAEYVRQPSFEEVAWGCEEDAMGCEEDAMAGDARAAGAGITVIVHDDDTKQRIMTKTYASSDKWDTIIKDIRGIRTLIGTLICIRLNDKTCPDFSGYPISEALTWVEEFGECKGCSLSMSVARVDPTEFAAARDLCIKAKKASKDARRMADFYRGRKIEAQVRLADAKLGCFEAGWDIDRATLVNAEQEHVYARICEDYERTKEARLVVQTRFSDLGGSDADLE